MALKIGVVMDPIAEITYYKDTTLALLLAASERGHELYYMEPTDLYLNKERARAYASPLRVFDDSEHWFETDAAADIALGELDAILMRKDPPFDTDFIYSTYILEAAQRQGAMVVNNPASLRDCNEKIFATHFPQCCPPMIVSARMDQLKNFYKEHGDVIFKPLDGMGGSGIFRCKPQDPNVSSILETLTEHGRHLIMAQKFIPEISNGDKRILIVGGEAIPYALARIPAAGETRGNLAAGGRGEPQPLTERDRWIVSQVADELVARGLLFVGLDVIGDYLTEINVTSPTCVREIDRAYDTQIGAKLMLAIENRLADRTH
ncbi:glutathione synthase [Gilvimarinus xylanilyticus]|uniref:Glutathione synthetase n=1 Tax=Gilvimarinus xylanilyticus TaxID=2944139 RepID=A0A9X2I4L6_9GAMM|nr:glutathione synthase [Gilvimarinus xylanilyticus]MCP8899931.1 glutathione synthase [Gilvimarinus xylanilyticus]